MQLNIINTQRYSTGRLLVLGLTIARVNNLHSGRVWVLQHSHHWFGQLDLKGLRRLKLMVSKDLDSPGGPSLTRVKLDLLLCLASKVLVLLCGAILCVNAWRIMKATYTSYTRDSIFTRE